MHLIISIHICTCFYIIFHSCAAHLHIFLQISIDGFLQIDFYIFIPCLYVFVGILHLRISMYIPNIILYVHQGKQHKNPGQTRDGTSFDASPVFCVGPVKLLASVSNTFHVLLMELRSRATTSLAPPEVVERLSIAFICTSILLIQNAQSVLFLLEFKNLCKDCFGVYMCLHH